MSETGYPALICDHEDGCDEYALDHTLGGLGRLIDSETQLPEGWSGARPGDKGEHFCPEHSADRATEGAGA
ncbi:hypothetical protein [Nocardioides aurantiacus]|uniref:Uncharacterized protein n=1 Tax=Nocardioides aurantiacus TaxID=86796 RepID=A0A3N2CW24_9ACTN|nr:hypothetical protein [Nocardioides aurantiacus]ROR91741.1 hypothetical protein EDD33_2616 [Nocardioides aurantiacus]